MATARNPQIRCAILSAFTILSLSFPAYAKYSGGTGEPNDPYQIATAADLIALGETPADYDKHFIMTADIDLDPNLPNRKVFDKAVIAADMNDTNWVFDGTPFAGVFDGSGHKIKNLMIQNDTASFLGLFGNINSTACVQNLGLENVLMKGSDRIGGVVGISHGQITDCYVNGTVIGVGHSDRLGGIVGVNSWGIISNCQADTIVIGGEESLSIGGMVGSCSGGGIKNSCSTGIVSAGGNSSELGGLVGYLYDGDIKDSYATGNVTGGNRSSAVGGLVGYIWYGNISRCNSTGSVAGDGNSRSLGGFVGTSSASIITNCYSTGSVSGNWALGGLVGNLLVGSKITNCYAVGRVSSIANSANSGGLVGSIGREYIWVNDCFWDVETSGFSRSAAGTGLSTAQMQDVRTYQNAGWDFAGYRTDGTSDIWRMPEDGGYPELTIFADGYKPHELAGAGTPEDPYQIATAEDLGALCWYDRSTSYKLVNDIDLSGITWANAPVPDIDGSFDGNGHRIKNLTIQGGTTDFYLGLFGSIRRNGWIRNLGLENVSITAGDESFIIGGLAGSNNGNISCCYVTGNISVAEASRYIGGLVGSNLYYDINYSYSMCNISNGNNCKRIGGLVGDNFGKITQCFAGGWMVSEGDSTELGGLVGYNAQRDYLINSCFWDAERSGLSVSDGGTGLSTAQMQDPNVFMGAGWDFAHESDGPSDIWAQSISEGHPILWWQLPESQWPPLPSFSGGTGEPNNPYLISAPNELNSIGYNPRLVALHYALINDIDLEGVRFFIIGNETFPFSGIFDGNGRTVSNFNYTSTNTDHVGFFGYIDGLYAEVKNLGLIDPNVAAITEVYMSSVGSLIGHLENGIVSGCYVQGGSVSGSGHNTAGGVIGVSYGIIIDCGVTCSVSGTVGVGGLAGSGRGIVAGCKSSGEVSGNNYVGGLLGSAAGMVTKCTSSCNVSGNNRIGGLIGDNRAEVIYCYSTGDVLSEGSHVGGLAGYNTRTIANSYAAGNTSGNSIVGGLVGSNGYIQTWDVYWETPGDIVNCYSTGGVYGTSTAGGLLGHNVVGSVMSSLWDKENTGQYDMCGIQGPEASGCNNDNGKTTTEMQTAKTFLDAGWDFVGETANGTDDIWWINEGKDYPRLWWETR